ncbi:MAG TPA: hypothetical protein VLH39_03160, partial [Magnetospirillaceae bacterium]|nr:hypothetical protein [Magnetospirillaceae bacterium]
MTDQQTTPRGTSYLWFPDLVPHQERLVVVAEQEEELRFSYKGIYAYLGPTQIIASAVMYRLFLQAIDEMSPGKPPQRTGFDITLGFSGLGIAEASELITRLKTRNPQGIRVCPPPADCPAPKAGDGALYFEITMEGSRRMFWPLAPCFDDTFR